MKQAVFDAHEYWRSRHATASLQSIGPRSFTDTGVRAFYRPVEEAFSTVLKELSIPENFSFLDAGAGLGVFAKVLVDEGYSDILAVDVSERALSAIGSPIRTLVSPLETLSQSVNKKYDVVYCFDVLLHVVDTSKWRQVIAELCTVSDQYVMVHQFFPRWFSIPVFQHVRFRTKHAHDAEFKKHGFERVHEIPTHALFMRMPFYLLFRLAPAFCATLDAFMVKVGSKLGFGWAASHSIIVYQRRSK